MSMSSIVISHFSFLVLITCVQLVVHQYYWYFERIHLLVSLFSSIDFLFSMSLIFYSNWYHIFSLLCLVLICSFSSFIRWKFGLSILDFFLNFFISVYFFLVHIQCSMFFSKHCLWYILKLLISCVFIFIKLF